MGFHGVTRRRKMFMTFAVIGWCDENGRGWFDVDDEYERFRRRQRIHWMHLVGYVVSAILILIGMLLFGH